MNPHRLSWLAIVVAIGFSSFSIWAVFCYERRAERLSLLDNASRFPSSQLKFERTSLGEAAVHVPRIAHVQICDLDQDRQLDILVCDCVKNTISWLRANSDGGGWSESDLIKPNQFSDPAHTTVVDIDGDGDGDLDILVAVLGSVIPDDARNGQVVLLVNDGQQQFQLTTVLDDLRRVTDIQPGDFDGDGDIDLVVAEFGYDHGRILLLENVGSGNFVDRELMIAPGTIHVPVADFDGDGDLDFAANVTQDEEEVWVFENIGAVEGGIAFKPRRIHFSINYDLGGAGLIARDLDQDGDIDLLMVAGDALELVYHYPQPYHGCWFIENRGQLNFQIRKIAELGGVYAVDTGDLDGDGDMDIVLSSMFNDWRVAGSASLVWLENNGQQQFTTWQVDDSPSHLCTVACGDLDADGRVDIVAGALHTYEPFDRLGRVVAWHQMSSSEDSSQALQPADSVVAEAQQ